MPEPTALFSVSYMLYSVWLYIPQLTFLHLFIQLLKLPSSAPTRYEIRERLIHPPPKSL
ncbi:hypothetical protein EG68_07314 [Paragonimus skrjabini miyazakii]|uniref:Uncharacterized protein n=1 Tax=Paragonimus skrjabini miyazakii TaxID=59628 RepID=A0A8S9YPV8_9TREM|nr:hypothetical protein EG68_07314 [Paragonimus skrjabini miyazakii]